MGTPTVLFFGYGNPGRQDDGLGQALAREVERLGIPGVSVETDYQLTVEYSLAVGAHDVVVFADADVGGPGPYRFEPVAPKATLHFSSHGIEPPALLALAEQVTGRRPEGYLLGIRGYLFDDLDERLSPEADANLASAVQFIEPVLRNRTFRAAAAAAAATARSDAS